MPGSSGITAVSMAFATLLLPAACGGDDGLNGWHGVPRSALEASELAGWDEEFARIPNYALVRVGLSEGGQVEAQAELRILATHVGLETLSDVIQGFADAELPEVLVDQPLVRESDFSKQIWLSWSREPRFFRPALVCPTTTGGSSAFALISVNQTPQAWLTEVEFGCRMQLMATEAPISYAPLAKRQSLAGELARHEFWLDYQPWLHWRGLVWNYGAKIPSYFIAADAAYYVYEKAPFW